MRRILFALLAVAMVAVGCDSDGEAPPLCPPTDDAPDTTKLWHGMACQNDDECAYGVCYKHSQTLGLWDGEGQEGGSGICVKRCPYNIFRMDEEHAVINEGQLERCILDRTCERSCPTGAISIVEAPEAENDAQS